MMVLPSAEACRRAWLASAITPFGGGSDGAEGAAAENDSAVLIKAVVAEAAAVCGAIYLGGVEIGTVSMPRGAAAKDGGFLAAADGFEDFGNDVSV